MSNDDVSFFIAPMPVGRQNRPSLASNASTTLRWRLAAPPSKSPRSKRADGDIFLQHYLRGSTEAMLELEVKQLIIDVLQLEDIPPDAIDSGAPLFGEGLGLDSIDALELSVALQKKYGISLSAESAQTRRHFASVQALAAMIASDRKK